MTINLLSRISSDWLHHQNRLTHHYSSPKLNFSSNWMDPDILYDKWSRRSLSADDIRAWLNSRSLQSCSEDQLDVLTLALCGERSPCLPDPFHAGLHLFFSVLCEMRIFMRSDRDRVGYVERILGVIVSPFPCLSFLLCNNNQCGLEGRHSKHGCIV